MSYLFIGTSISTQTNVCIFWREPDHRDHCARKRPLLHALSLLAFANLVVVEVSMEDAVCNGVNPVDHPNLVTNIVLYLEVDT